MDQAIKTLIPLVKANDYLFNGAVEGVPTEDLHKRPHDNSNPMIWVAGHVMSSRVSLTKMIGVELENPWGKLFARGATIDENISYPGITEITSLWKEATGKLLTRLEELTEDELNSESRFPLPTTDKTQRGAIFFLNLHETYHIGQLAYLRKWLGHSQLIG